MLGLLLAGAAVFAVIAWIIDEATIKKIAVLGFAICAIVFIVLVILSATGQVSLTLP